MTDYFTMYNTTDESNGDEDLGSGGALVLPDMTDASGKVQYLAIGAGKDGNIYLVDRTTWVSSIRRTIALFIRSWMGACRAVSGRCRLITTAGFISARWAAPYGRFSSVRRCFFHSRFGDRHTVSLSRRHAQYLGEWRDERDPVGGGE